MSRTHRAGQGWPSAARSQGGRRAAAAFVAVRSVGGLLPEDLLQRIVAFDSKLPGLSAESYHLAAHDRLGEAISRSWSQLVGHWQAFRDALADLPEGDAATRTTRERWLLPLLQELGYGRLPAARALELDGKTFAVSHLYQHTPIHLLGAGLDLGTRTKGVKGAATSSPHGLVQDLLNRSDAHLWGILSNGLALRLLRDHKSLTRQAYVEFDLQAIFDGNLFPEFRLLWLVCHQSRIEAEKPEQCWLEQWFHASKEEGIRALDRLRDGVQGAIEALGQGFLRCRENGQLHERLSSGALDAQEYYRRLLRLVYRLIFLFVAEERDALLDPGTTAEARELFSRYYSTARLRALANRQRGSVHGDLWRSLRLVMAQLWDGCPALGLPALGSFLWSPAAVAGLPEAELGNDALLSAIRSLCVIQDGGVRRLVSWQNIGAEELGSVYESLLELHPRLNREAGTFVLESAAGHERKTTGSYYTPSSLVDCLLDSALEPVLAEARKKTDAEAAILALKVCDPACGSGHFLIAAARRIARKLANVRSGDEEPSPEALQTALRDVVGYCIFGVDLNPMAVELAKVSLWMEAIEPGRPLSFLDGHIQCGNSLLGATPELMEKGIPDEAWTALEGDDPEVARRLKKRNRQALGGQMHLAPYLGPVDGAARAEIAGQAQAVEAVADTTLLDLHHKEENWARMRHSPAYREAWALADTWCAAFVWPKEPGEAEQAAPTHDLWLKLQRDTSAAPPSTRRVAQDLALRYSFFHWHLAFPLVFRAEGKSGFDCVLGNPPWEHVELKEKEWFAERRPEIATARTGGQRKKLIANLREEDPLLHRAFVSELRIHDGMIRFMGACDRYPLSGHGRLNLYAVFAECMHFLLDHHGICGAVLPTGIVTDDTTKLFFQSLVDRRSILSFYDFENRLGIFPSIDGRMRFSLITFGKEERTSSTEFVFFAHNVQDIRDPDRRFALTREDLGLLNPDTRTCPAFRSSRDAERAKMVARRTPQLIRESQPAHNYWNIQVRRMFNMGLTEVSSLAIPANRTVLRADAVPMYEGKMFTSYNHRSSSVVFNESNLVRGAQSSETEESQLADPKFLPSPLYYYPRIEMSRSTDPWMLCYKDIASSTNERSMIAAILPGVATNFSIRVVKFQGDGRSTRAIMLISALNSLVFDYLLRQSLGGLHLSDYIVRQIPVPSPDSFESMSKGGMVSMECWLLPRVLELTYTAWDLTAFARDCGYAGPPFRWDPARRSLLRAELDAALFHLYGISREDVDYILDTFPIVRKNDQKAFGEYRTKRLILERFDALAQTAATGIPYVTPLDPPPADPRCAHPDEPPDWLHLCYQPEEAERCPATSTPVQVQRSPVVTHEGRQRSAPRLAGATRTGSLLVGLSDDLPLFRAPTPTPPPAPVQPTGSLLAGLEDDLLLFGGRSDAGGMTSATTLPTGPVPGVAPLPATRPTVAVPDRPQIPGTSLLDRALALLHTQPGRALTRSDFLAALGDVTDGQWQTLAKQLAEHPEVEAEGERRGRRYRWAGGPR